MYLQIIHVCVNIYLSSTYCSCCSWGLVFMVMVLFDVVVVGVVLFSLLHVGGDTIFWFGGL